MSENLTDNQLIELIKHGEIYHYKSLIERYTPYITVKASKCFADGYDTEDFVQEGLIALCSAIKTYDPQKAQFNTYVTTCIDNAINTALKRALPPKIKEQKDDLNENLQKKITFVPIDQFDIESDFPDKETPESILINNETITGLEQNVKENTSKLEYNVFCEFTKGKSYAEIAKTLGVSEKTVDNALRRIREKLKK